MAKGAQGISNGTRRAKAALPDGVADWSGQATGSVRQMGARVSRLGLSPNAVVKKHKKRGHDVESLYDVRRLDLQHIDAAYRRGSLGIYYPLGAAISGGTAAFVVNAGTAMSSSAKSAAMADISRLTQALYRDKTWAVLLDSSLVARVSKRMAEKFVNRFTKKSLGKLVPGVGIVLGSGFNWATLEGIVDVADLAYRRRFLLDKYPHLADEETPGPFLSSGKDSADNADEVISVLDELDEEGGPHLH